MSASRKEASGGTTSWTSRTAITTAAPARRATRTGRRDAARAQVPPRRGGLEEGGERRHDQFDQQDGNQHRDDGHDDRLADELDDQLAPRRAEPRGAGAPARRAPGR